MTTIHAADLFCGAGGTSTGLLLAARSLGITVRLLAVNHWRVAIDTHSANHPDARHLSTGLESVTPAEVVPGGKLDLLWASPSCTHHSIARSGRPCNDQSRAQPLLVLDWLANLYVKRVMIENVPEFINWGPLDSHGKPIKAKKGALFQMFLKMLGTLGYRWEWRVLCCADYGDPTTRGRFFLQAVRGKGRIVWPEPGYARDPKSVAHYTRPWVPARDVIDWSVPGKSIFRRKKPLAANTLRRIEAGIRKYWGSWAEPFLVVLRGTKSPEYTSQSLGAPLPTVTAGGEHMALIEPFLTVMNNWPHQQTGYPIDRPLPSQTTANHIGVVEPFIVPNFGEREGQSPRTHGIDGPMPTITGHGAGALIEPFIIPQHSCGAPHGMGQPVPTITTDGACALVEPFIATVSHGTPDGNFARRVSSIDDPLRTLTATNEAAVVQPFITVAGGATGQGRQPHSVGDTLGTILPHDRRILVSPFLVSFYGAGEALSVDKPFATITTKDRFGVVQQYGLDILFRMLQPHELARAHSFPKDYIFYGTKSDVIRQIGNSVPVKTAQALCEAALSA